MKKSPREIKSKVTAIQNNPKKAICFWMNRERDVTGDDSMLQDLPPERVNGLLTRGRDPTRGSVRTFLLSSHSCCGLLRNDHPCKPGCTCSMLGFTYRRDHHSAVSVANSLLKTIKYTYIKLHINSMLLHNTIQTQPKCPHNA